MSIHQSVKKALDTSLTFSVTRPKLAYVL